MFCTICGDPDCGSWLCYPCRVEFIAFEREFTPIAEVRTSYYLDIREGPHGISLGSEFD